MAVVTTGIPIISIKDLPEIVTSETSDFIVLQRGFGNFKIRRSSLFIDSNISTSTFSILSASQLNENLSLINTQLRKFGGNKTTAQLKALTVSSYLEGTTFQDIDVDCKVSVIGGNKLKYENLNFSTISELKTFDVGTNLYLNQIAKVSDGTGRSGEFKLKSGYPSEPTGDYQGIELSYAGSTTYHWHRIYSGPVKVEWFGVIADNSTDSTPALSAATIYLSGGQVIDFGIPGNGTVLTDPILVYGIDNITVIGDKKTIYKVNNSKISQVIQFTECDNLRIDGLYIDGNQANESGTDAGTDGGDAGIELYNCNYGVIENCYITNTHVRGVKCYGGHGNVIKDNIADTIRGNAFALYTGRDGMIINNVVRNITIDPSFSDAKHAIDIGGQVQSRAQNCRVEGNIFYNLAGSAIQSTNADNTIFANNQGELIGATILKFDNVSNGSMINNQFIKGGKYGIFFDGSAGIVTGQILIKGNIIKDLDPSYQQISPTVSGQNIGMRKPPPNARIEGNVFDNMQICVFLEVANTAVEFYNNTFENAQRAIHFTTDTTDEEACYYDGVFSYNKFKTILYPAINSNSYHLINNKIIGNSFIDVGTSDASDTDGVAIVLTAESSGNLISQNSCMGTFRCRMIYQADSTNSTNTFINNITEGRPGTSFRFFDDNFNLTTVENNIQRVSAKLSPGIILSGDSYNFMLPLDGASPLDELSITCEDPTSNIDYSVQVAQSAVDESLALSATNTLTISAHPFVDTQYVFWNSDTGVGGLTDLAYYYVIYVDRNTIQLESSIGGGAINITSAGTGTAWLRAYNSVTATITNNSGSNVFLAEDIKRRTPLQITNGGSGYIPTYNVSLSTNGSGSNMSIVIDEVDGSGVITSAYTLRAGDGYRPNDIVVPTSGGGSGAIFTLRDNGLTITTPDSGYSTGTNIPVSTNGNGTGMTVDITSVGGSGEITGVTLNKLGAGYKTGEIVTPVGGNAELTFTLSDFNMQVDVMAKINDGESRRVGDIKFIKKVIQHDEISESSGNSWFFELPRFYHVENIHSWVSTSFTAGTTVEIGSAGDPNLLKTSYAVDNTNRNLFTPASTKVILTGSDLPIFVTKNQPTSQGTLYLTAVIRKMI